MKIKSNKKVTNSWNKYKSILNNNNFLIIIKMKNKMQIYNLKIMLI